MKSFTPFAWKRRPALAELAEFRTLLDRQETLAEAADIGPLFRRCQHLASLVGSLYPQGVIGDSLAYEYELFGDFVCDLVVGSRAAGRYVFVEFEEAQPDSIFRRLGKKALRDWSPTFEHGCSQLIDWFCRLHDADKSDVFEARFGARSIDYSGLLVVGRDCHLEPGERRRLEWRRSRVVVDSRRIACVTYDELLNDLAGFLGWFEAGGGKRRTK